LADQTPLAPVDLDQEGQHRLLDRLAAGDADDRATARIERDRKVQAGDQARGWLQADPAEGVGRGQPRLQLLELRRVAGDDRDLGEQRLAAARLHLDLAQSQRERRPGEDGQQQAAGECPRPDAGGSMVCAWPRHGGDSSRPGTPSATHQPSAATSSASWTAFNAAPLRMLSETIQRLSPRGCEMSSRMRPTYTASLPEAWVTGVG